MNFLRRLFSKAAPPESNAPVPGGPADRPNPYLGLRDLALSSGAKLAGTDPSAVVCVLAEFTSTAGAPVTVAGYADGTASMYFGNGGGMLGGQAYPSCRAAAVRLAQLGSTLAARFEPSPNNPLPVAGQWQFYAVTAVTAAAVTRAAAPADAVMTPSHPLHPLFAASNDIITGFRLKR